MLDSATLEVTQTIPVGQRPRGIKLTHGRQISADLRQRRRHRADAGRGEPRNRRRSAVRPRSRAAQYSSLGHPVYVANEDDNLLTAIDIADKKVVAEVEVGVEPEGVGVSPDGKTVVVTSETTNMAHFIDTDSYEITDNVLVGAAAALRRVHG